MLLAAGYVVGEVGWLVCGQYVYTIGCIRPGVRLCFDHCFEGMFNDSLSLLRPLQLFAILAMSLSDSQTSIVTLIFIL
jgi:hypothetical protein